MIRFASFNIRGDIVLTHENHLFWSTGYDEFGIKGFYIGCAKDGVFNFKHN